MNEKFDVANVGMQGGNVFRDLERFVVDNPDLERLEAQLGQFNMFEAIGTTRQELRHSDFLAFLLRPQESHAIGDAFVRRLLQRSLNSSTVEGISPIVLHLLNLSDIVVQREWRNIDLLLVSEQNKLVVAVENKIGTGEHSGQLTRYRQIVEDHYPQDKGWRRLFLFLTPDGIAPSDTLYVSVGYDTVCECIDFLCESRASLLGSDVLTVVRHYAQMLRRQVVTDSQVSELCQQIYQKHRHALDRIFQEIKDTAPQNSPRAIVEALVRENDTLVFDSATKSEVRFAVRAWDQEPGLLQGGALKSRRLLCFYVSNSAQGLKLILYITAGPQQTRAALFNKARENASLFNPNVKTLSPVWSGIYQRILVPSSEFGLDETALEQYTQKAWREFVANDLPALSALVQPGDYPAVVQSGRDDVWVEKEMDSLSATELVDQEETISPPT